MKFGVVVFPGSNCDHDTYHALKHVLGCDTRFLWHKDAEVAGVDAVIIPGGFSFGDYLRCGSIAKFSPIMEGVRKHAQAGGLVLGICNGFQILQEAGLLPGVMLRNRRLKFICEDVHVRVENVATPFTRLCRPGQILRIPIAHNEGNFFVTEPELARMGTEGQVVLTYSTIAGEVTPEANPNGSTANIAGVCNRQGNVMGMMPHPERSAELLLGSADGLIIFESMMHWLENRKRPAVEADMRASQAL